MSATFVSSLRSCMQTSEELSCFLTLAGVWARIGARELSPVDWDDAPASVFLAGRAPSASEPQ